MAMLNITGYGDIEVDSDGATEEEPEEGGEDVRTDAGNLRSMVSWTKRSWSFTTGWLTQANYNSLKAICANGATRVCNGDAIDNANVSCRIKFRGGDYVDEAGLSFKRIAKLTLIEV